MTTLGDVLLPARRLGITRNRKRRAMEPVGVMLHYDGSTGADKWAIEWFLDPRCKVSYDRLYTDDGAAVDILGGDVEWAAYHAGICLVEPGLPVRTLSDFPSFRYGDANAGYLGYSITTGPGHPATLAQVNALQYDVAATFLHFGWTSGDVGRRLVAHSAKAILNPRDNPGIVKTRWGKLGRKEDPIGPDAAHPVLAFEAFGESIAMILRAVERGALMPLPGAYDVHAPMGLAMLMLA